MSETPEGQAPWTVQSLCIQSWGSSQVVNKSSTVDKINCSWEHPFSHKKEFFLKICEQRLGCTAPGCLRPHSVCCKYFISRKFVEPHLTSFRHCTRSQLVTMASSVSPHPSASPSPIHPTLRWLPTAHKPSAGHAGLFPSWPFPNGPPPNSSSTRSFLVFAFSSVRHPRSPGPDSPFLALHFKPPPLPGDESPPLRTPLRFHLTR